MPPMICSRDRKALPPHAASSGQARPPRAAPPPPRGLRSAHHAAPHRCHGLRLVGREACPAKLEGEDVGHPGLLHQGVKEGLQAVVGLAGGESRGRTGMCQRYPFSRGFPRPGELPSPGPLCPRDPGSACCWSRAQGHQHGCKLGPEDRVEARREGIEPCWDGVPTPAGRARLSRCPEGCEQDSPGRSRRTPTPGSLPSWSR